MPEDDLYLPTATAVLDVLSPGDETYATFDFYARHGVTKILVADPLERWVTCYGRRGGDYQEHGDYQEQGESAVFGISMADLTAQIRWPS